MALQDTSVVPLYNGGGDWNTFNAEICPLHWKKRGAQSHGYNFNGEATDEAEDMVLLREWITGDQFKSRTIVDWPSPLFRRFPDAGARRAS